MHVCFVSYNFKLIQGTSWMTEWQEHKVCARVGRKEKWWSTMTFLFIPCWQSWQMLQSNRLKSGFKKMTNCSLKYRRRQDEKRNSNKTETDWMVMNKGPERRLKGENRCVFRGLTSTVTATDGWQQVGQPLCCTSDLSTWEQTDRPSAWGLDLPLLWTCVRCITYRNQGVFHLFSSVRFP